MKHCRGAALGLAFALAPLSLAVAQISNGDTVNLGEMDVVEQLKQGSPAAAQVKTGEGVEAGTSTLGAEAIAEQSRGGMDTTEILRALPFVQMDINRRDVSNESVQSLRPSDFSISGGDSYSNNIMINGVGVNNIMDVTNTNPLHFNEVGGQTSQTLYLDPSLIGEIIVHDSNVSARYGDFTGGVVEMNVRDPKDKFGVTLSTEVQTDSFVKYKLTDNNIPEDLSELPAPPEFTKIKSNIAVDLPVNERLKFLVSYSWVESTVDYTSGEKYGEILRENSDNSQNFLAKGVYTFSDELRAEAQVTYSPYESEAQSPNGIENIYTSDSSGLTAYVKFEGSKGDVDWESQLSYSGFDGGREGPANNFSWPSSADAIDWCSSTNCTIGGFGSLDQDQEEIVWDFFANQPLGSAELSYGFELANVDAKKARPVDNFAYSRGKSFDQLACPAGDVACIENQSVLEQYSVYESYNAEVNIKKSALWAEVLQEFGDVDVRLGLRYSYDDFLENSNLSPRFVTSWEFMPEARLSFGVNRYYSNNMVGYAIRSQYPDSYIYRRNTFTDENGVEQVEDWSIYRHSRSSDYSQANLDTPFTDELALSLELPTALNGKLLIKAVQRDFKDKFARSARERVSFDSETNSSSTTSLYILTNAGESEYKGVAVQWTANLHDNHSLALKAAWSETLSYGGQEDYFDQIDDEDLLNSFVYYGGRVISEAELSQIADRSNFATPITGSVSLSSRWFEGKLSTNLRAFYSGSKEQIEDAGDNITIDDVRYDEYAIVTRKAQISFNLNAEYELFKKDNQRATLTFKVDNLFGDLPNTITSKSNPYQEGRSYWIGARYSF